MQFGTALYLLLLQPYLERLEKIVLYEPNCRFLVQDLDLFVCSKVDSDRKAHTKPLLLAQHPRRQPLLDRPDAHYKPECIRRRDRFRSRHWVHRHT